MKTQQSKNCRCRTTPSCRSVVARIVIATLLVTAMPPRLPGQWPSNADTLPGIVSGKSIALILAAAGGAMVGMVFLSRKKGGPKLSLTAKRLRFDNKGAHGELNRSRSLSPMR